MMDGHVPEQTVINNYYGDDTQPLASDNSNDQGYFAGDDSIDYSDEDSDGDSGWI